MTTYLLHGGMLRYENASNDAYFKEIAEFIPENGTALIVLFASEEERWPEQFENVITLVKAQADGKNIDFKLATREHFIEEIAAADAIVIRGGSTNRLLEALRAYALSMQSFEGKIVTGASAGAYALAQFGYDKSHKSIRTGLGFVPVRVLCHYMSDKPEEHTDDAAIEILNSAHQELDLVVLEDSNWKKFTI